MPPEASRRVLCARRLPAAAATRHHPDAICRPDRWVPRAAGRAKEDWRHRPGGSPGHEELRAPSARPPIIQVVGTPTRSITPSCATPRASCGSPRPRLRRRDPRDRDRHRVSRSSSTRRRTTSAAATPEPPGAAENLIARPQVDVGGRRRARRTPRTRAPRRGRASRPWRQLTASTRPTKSGGSFNPDRVSPPARPCEVRARGHRITVERGFPTVEVARAETESTRPFALPRDLRADLKSRHGARAP